jgi:chromosome partitioning protein
MWRIAFVTKKGGSGKSTLAACLAVAAKQAGERVFMVDLDSLRSLRSWSEARDSNDIPVVAAPPDKLGALLAELAAKGVSLAILDTPGGDGDVAEHAIEAAQFCVVPARPNAFDLAASKKTLKKIKSFGREFAFALNQCPPARQSARIEDGVTALEAMGALLSPLITTRVDYQEATRRGLGVTELNPSGVAAQEMRAFWLSVRSRLLKIAPPAKGRAA